jgi:AcrR family transcriptional regulator
MTARSVDSSDAVQSDPPSARRRIVARRRAPSDTQRERLLDAMIELSARLGYRQVSVAAVASHAGVSSATFYEQFRGKEECMEHAYTTAARRILPDVRVPSEGSETARPAFSELARVFLTRLMHAAQAEPAAARVLFVEGLAGTPSLRKLSVAILGSAERTVETALASTDQRETFDVPAAAVVGAVRSIVSRTLRIHAEDQLPRHVDDLVRWLVSYKRPPCAQPFTLDPGMRLAPISLKLTSEPLGSVTRLPRGRHRLPPGVVLRSHRTRIIAATAQVTMTKGYAATTIADIVAHAGVSREVFYEHFSDKEHAFLEAQQHPTQHILDRCAQSYFAAREWPQRLWNHVEMLARLIVENPAISHLRLVECYAAGPPAIRRAEEITRAFNIFLQEGYSYSGTPERPRIFSDAITGAIYEVIRRHVAAAEFAQLYERVPLLTYIGLVPFTGAEQAADLIAQMLATHEADTNEGV